MVEDPCKQLHLFGAGAVEQAVVDNEDVPALFVRQGLHEAVDDAGGKQCRETLPVRPGVVEETVDGVFGESRSKCACLHLHIEAPVGEHHTEQETEDIHDRDTFFFSGIAFEEQLSKVEPLHEFCSKIRNTVSIIGCLWYTGHGMNLLAV